LITKHTTRAVLWIGAAILSSAAAPLAVAQSAAGDQELQITAGIFMAEGDAATGTVSGEVSYGYFLGPRAEVGARQLFSYSRNDPIEDVWTGSTTIFINYHPWMEQPGRKLQPFIGAFAGAGYSDVDITGTAGPAGGLKYFFSERLFFAAQYRFEYYFDSLDAGEETANFNDGNHVFTLGMGFLW
jgi:hypothetical protein